jgi:beta-glucosidase/6-phospho-beta-glucosidase/beta-galactosidase
MYPPLFNSFFMGGFECSTQRTGRGRRLDMIAATKHDRFAQQDYARLRKQGMKAARDGVRWHLIEAAPGCYDFSSVLPMVRAARKEGLQIIWDVCHYGWPDDLDIFSPQFVERYAGLARAFVRFLTTESDDIPVISPVNEISFFSWAGGSVAYFNPFASDRGPELKTQLVRAAIAGMEEMRSVEPRTRFVHADPVINVIPAPDRPQDEQAAKNYTNSQFEAWDMICGRMAPELGGNPAYLDIIGLNYYHDNQWLAHNGEKVLRGNPLYKPFHCLAEAIYARYGRPLFVAETGADGDLRSGWLEYMCNEVRVAQAHGVPIGGICLYPIVKFPAWDDEYELQNGLWGSADAFGNRYIDVRLAAELRLQQYMFEDPTTGASLSGAESSKGVW